MIKKNNYDEHLQVTNAKIYITKILMLITLTVTKKTHLGDLLVYQEEFTHQWLELEGGRGAVELYHIFDFGSASKIAPVACSSLTLLGRRCDIEINSLLHICNEFSHFHM